MLSIARFTHVKHVLSEGGVDDNRLYRQTVMQLLHGIYNFKNIMRTKNGKIFGMKQWYRKE